LIAHVPLLLSLDETTITDFHLRFTQESLYENINIEGAEFKGKRVKETIINNLIINL